MTWKVQMMIWNYIRPWFFIYQMNLVKTFNKNLVEAPVHWVQNSFSSTFDTEGAFTEKCSSLAPYQWNHQI